MNDVAARERSSKFAERRNEVLRTAARVFSERGFRQATLDDVARALNVTRPALYHYARSKDELLHEAGLIARRELNLAGEEASNAPSGRKRVRAFFRRYAELVCDDFGRCFVLVDHTEMEADEAKRSRDFQARLGKAVVAFVQSGNKDGSLQVARPGDLSRMLFAVINGVPRWRAQSGRSAAEIADSFLDMIEPASVD